MQRVLFGNLIMKISVLCAGFAKPHVGWVAIDEFAELLVHYFNAELLVPNEIETPFIEKLLGRQKAVYSPLDTDGGDALIVVANNPGDLAMINAIPNYKKKFTKIYAWITDSYFYAGYPKETADYDAVTVTAHEDAQIVRERFKIKVFPLYQGANCLKWVPDSAHQPERAIDIIGFGRMPSSYHDLLTKTMHDAHSPYLYLHSPLGHIEGANVHQERGMLFKLLHRSKISLAFHLYVEPKGNRPRSMMVTSRWLESLLSGCIVAGKRPISKMAEDILCWPDVTVELSEQPEIALDQLMLLLKDNEKLEHQRKVNIQKMLQLHDWRYRIQEMCEIFNLQVPPLLNEDLHALNVKASQFN
jgi:Glycosyl transferases group 1